MPKMKEKQESPSELQDSDNFFPKASSSHQVPIYIFLCSANVGQAVVCL